MNRPIFNNSEEEYKYEKEQEYLRGQRYREQEKNQDYSIDLDGNREKCEVCGNYTNSIYKCPLCDYW